MNDTARKEFYVTVRVWDSDLSCRAKMVFAYLSYCANKNGECWPSVVRISEVCGICQTTVRKAINELVAKGRILCEHRIVPAGKGRRQTSNAYKILQDRKERTDAVPEAAKTSKEAGKSAQAAKPQEKKAQAAVPAAASSRTPDTAGEEHGSAKPRKQEAHAEREPERKPAPKPKPAPKWNKQQEAQLGSILDYHDPAIPVTADLQLELLLKKLDIRGLYYDKYAAKAVELALSDLWYAKELRVGADMVSQYRIRRRLMDLDIDCIDSVMENLATEGVRDKHAYIMTCLYNAPARINAITAGQIAEFESRRRWMKSTVTGEDNVPAPEPPEPQKTAESGGEQSFRTTAAELVRQAYREFGVEW